MILTNKWFSYDYICLFVLDKLNNFLTFIYHSNKLLEVVISKVRKEQKVFSPPGGLEPPTSRLTAERASQLRHGGI